MSTVLTKQSIQAAKTAVETYVSTARALYEELSNVITPLTTNDFIGDASSGWMTFYNTRVVPNLTANLTEDNTSIMFGIRQKLLELEELINVLDPNMGEENKA